MVSAIFRAGDRKKKDLGFSVPFLILNFFLLSAHAQERCKTNEVLKEAEYSNPHIKTTRENIHAATSRWVQENAASTGVRSVITVPVVVHVLYNKPEQNITDAQIISQIDVINEDFRRLNKDAANTPDYFKPTATDCEIEFCLAKQDPFGNPTSGIIRKETQAEFFSLEGAMKNPAKGGTTGWNGAKYLNIWVCNLSQGVLGFASYPGADLPQNDGIVISWKSFGRRGSAIKPYHLGRTVTHEIGHWLNLEHIWGDNDVSDVCSGTDFVDDTPNQAGASTGCPVFPRSSCNNYSDMFMNFMDYTRDSCMNMFTNGQKLRMLAVLNGYRSGIQSSKGCIEPPAKIECDTITNVLNPEGLYLYRSSTLFPQSKGFLIGHNNLYHKGFADLIRNNSSKKLSRLVFDFARADYGMSTDSIRIKVWEVDVSSKGPGKMLSEKKISVSFISDNIDSYKETELIFNPEIAVADSFFAGFEIDYLPGDSVVLNATEINPSSKPTAWYQNENGNWIAYSSPELDAKFSIGVFAYFCSTVPQSVYNLSDQDAGISVFPNPVRSVFFVSGLPVHRRFLYQMCSLDGRIVKSGEYTNGDQAFEMDASLLSPGIYFLTFSAPEKKYIMKVLIGNH